MQTLNAGDVFVPGGMPEHTYNPREKHGLEKKLRDAKKTARKIVSVTGMTKSGKTVLVARLFPRDSCVWFDGGAFTNEAEFWIDLVDQLGAFTSFSLSDGNERSVETAAEARAQGGLFGWLASLALRLGIRRSRTTGISVSRQSSPKAIALRTLRKRKVPLVLDDFHYLPRDDQKRILRALKQLIFEGVPIVAISIPHRKYDALKAERELTGRVTQVPVPAWDPEELVEIASKGFPLLNVETSDNLVSNLVGQALGSPHLMQEFCLALCRKHNVEETAQERLSISGNEPLRPLFQSVAEETGICQHRFRKYLIGCHQAA
ncbi:MAG: hypothetical protein PF508_12365 [Spirochaeta sp.]|nr:hypothetical protein [Spirochaeta sp.]